MNEPHSWNRRDFDVTPNGYFTILKPARWFARSLLAGGFRYAIGQSPKPAAPAPKSNFSSTQMPMDSAPRENPTILQWTKKPTRDWYGLVRTGLVVLLAMAGTLFLLFILANHQLSSGSLGKPPVRNDDCPAAPGAQPE
jgi:hypothetical protein